MWILSFSSLESIFGGIRLGLKVEPMFNFLLHKSIFNKFKCIFCFTTIEIN